MELSPFPQSLQVRLTAWSQVLQAPAPSAAGWSVHGKLPVEVDPGLRISLGPWSTTFEISDAAEMLDLLAAALFGRARVWVFTHGGVHAGHRLEVEVNSRWMDAGGAKPRRRLFRTPDAEELRNLRAPPADLRWGQPGLLPHAPWVGMLADTIPDPGVLPIDGELDLHPFSPKDVRRVVEAYIEACLEQGQLELRLVHGKGIGNLRRTVHALLEKHPSVASFRLGGMGEGGWGATLVTLRHST